MRVACSRYNASDGKNLRSKQPSGAYIFRPNSSTPFVISKMAKTESVQVEGGEQLFPLTVIIQKQPIHTVTYNLPTPHPSTPFHLDPRCAGGEAMVCSLVVPGGSSLHWQQNSRARVDCWTTASWVSVTLELVMLYGIAHFGYRGIQMSNFRNYVHFIFEFLFCFCMCQKLCKLFITHSLSLSISDGLGKEVITRLDTSIKTSQYFYTDSNGRELLQRK